MFCFLQIKNINEEHKHAVTETLFDSLPKECRLLAEYEHKVQNNMNLQLFIYVSFHIITK